MPDTYAVLKAPTRLLLGPGPSPVSPRVYAAMQQPVVGHLDPYFFEVVEDIRKLLGVVFSTANHHNYAISGTGSSGMETAVANFAEPGKKFAVLVNGFFGERIAEMARRHGADVVKLESAWGEPFDAAVAQAFIEREKPAVVAFVQAETSTGVFNQAKPICDAARAVDALVIGDCVTSLGAMPVLMDENGIDIAYSCSQKGLGCPPGLAPVSVSPRAWERLQQRTAVVHSWYLDLRLLETYYDGHKYHHTASATMLYALREGLAMAAEEGIENRWERHRRNHEAFVAGVEAMGMRMLVKPGSRLWTLNTVCVPDGVDELKVRQWLLNEHNIEISGGFGPLAGKIFRIGLMGYGSSEENVGLILQRLKEGIALQR